MPRWPLVTSRRRGALRSSGALSISERLLLRDAQAYWTANDALGTSDQWLRDLTANGHDARFGSGGRAVLLGPYLRLPGVSGNYASTPDHADLDITGDIDLRADVALETWTPAAEGVFVAKWNATGNQRSYQLYITVAGKLGLRLSLDGSASSVVISDDVVGLAAGARKWVRATWRQSDGRVQFFTSSDGVAWTQLGANQTIAIASIFSGTSAVEVGTANAGTGFLATGRFYRAQIRNGIDGTVVFDANFALQTRAATSFAETTGKTVTINQTTGVDTNDPLVLDYAGTPYAYFPDAGSNYITTPSTTFNGVSTGTIDIRARIRATDYTPALGGGIAGASTNRLFLRLETTGVLRYAYNNAADANQGVNSTAAVVATDNLTDLWVRAVHDLGADTVTFYTSLDNTNDHTAVTWSQLGTPVAIADGTLHANVDTLVMGRVNVGTTGPFDGRIYTVAWLRNGAVVASPNIANANPDAATFTDTQGNTWTLNRASTGRKLAVVEASKFLLGTDDYCEVPDHANLNFGTGQDFTVVVVERCYSTGTTGQSIAKMASAATVGWRLGKQSNENRVGQIHDGTNDASTTGIGSATAGQRVTLAVVRKAGVTVTAHVNDTTNSVTDTTGNLTNTQPLRIGAFGDGTSFLHFEFYAAAIFRRALSKAQIARVAQELLR